MLKKKEEVTGTGPAAIAGFPAVCCLCRLRICLRNLRRRRLRRRRRLGVRFGCCCLGCCHRRRSHGTGVVAIWRGHRVALVRAGCCAQAKLSSRLRSSYALLGNGERLDCELRPNTVAISSLRSVTCGEKQRFVGVQKLVINRDFTRRALFF